MNTIEADIKVTSVKMQAIESNIAIITSDIKEMKNKLDTYAFTTHDNSLAIRELKDISSKLDIKIDKVEIEIKGSIERVDMKHDILHKESAERVTRHGDRLTKLERMTYAGAVLLGAFTIIIQVYSTFFRH